jgi:pentose-5-phosphate-3-epimerase
LALHLQNKCHKHDIIQQINLKKYEVLLLLSTAVEQNLLGPLQNVLDAVSVLTLKPVTAQVLES